MLIIKPFTKIFLKKCGCVIIFTVPEWKVILSLLDTQIVKNTLSKRCSLYSRSFLCLFVHVNPSPICTKSQKSQ
jgi:hypothetical protein